jgi:hypothetical protein
VFVRSRIFVLVLLSAAACGDGDQLCTAEELTTALAEASSGDEVEIGACSITGHFTVPSGVMVRGRGSSMSRLVSDSSDPILIGTANAGDDPIVVRDLLLESSAVAGILVRGAGSAIVEQVQVNVGLGFGVAAEELASFHATSLVLRGPFNETNLAAVPFSLTATSAALAGLAVSGVQAVVMNGVDTAGFAYAGAAFANSDTMWIGGKASDNVSAGIVVEGGSFTASNAEVCRTLQPLTVRLAAGAFFGGGAVIETDTFNVCDSQGYGMLQDEGSARHVGLQASGNANAAVWLQKTISAEISGEISGNDFGGLIAVETQALTIDTATISMTQDVPRAFETFGSRRIGDGIQLVNPMQSTMLRNVKLHGNERTAILIDLAGGSTSNIMFDRVGATSVSANKGAVVAQNGMVIDGWDNGVLRQGGATPESDAMLAGTLQIVGAVGPCDRPKESGLLLGVRSVVGF